jgi:hypothetical protein
MPNKRPKPPRPATQLGTATAKPTLPPIPAEAALSFLKDTKRAFTWSVRDLTGTLKINRCEAEQVIALFAAQAYVQRASGADEWMTTPAGESVSGAKPPRFTRESVEQAVESLKERSIEVNRDPQAAFRITDAVAFGDFLVSDRARVQAADVGIGLAPRGEAESEDRSAAAARLELQFLREVRGKTVLLHVTPYAEWMSKRSYLISTYCKGAYPLALARLARRSGVVGQTTRRPLRAASKLDAASLQLGAAGEPNCGSRDRSASLTCGG